MKRWLPFSLLAIAWSAAAYAQAPPPNDTCDTAIEIACNESVELLVDTTFATNDYELLPDNVCTGFNSQGPDVAYKLVLPPNANIFFIFDTSPPAGTGLDGSLYLVTDCGDVLASCLQGSDNCNAALETEFITLTNDTGATLTTFLIVDGFMAETGGGCGTPAGQGTLTGSMTCDALPVEPATWGRVKGVYRN